MEKVVIKKELVTAYLNSLKKKTGLSYEAIAEEVGMPESTIKNLFSGRTEDPRLGTISPIIYAMGGSFDEMYNPDKTDESIKATSVEALKDSYEHDIQLMKESYDAQMNNVRAHYEQHHEDLKENFEKRLADKREMIDSYKDHIKTLEKECLHSKIAFWICICVFVAVLIAEVMNPNLGWFRY